MWHDELESLKKWDLSLDRRLLWRFSHSITITSMSGVGGSSTLKALREILNRQDYRFVSGGDAMRYFAKEVGMSIEDFAVYVREHPEHGYDRKIDEMLKKAGETNRLVAESRLVHGLIPGAFHVLLTCDPLIRATRRRRVEAYRNLSVENVAKLLIQRDAANNLRFSDLYTGYNWNEKDYDFVQSTDSESASPLDRARQIVIEHYRWKSRIAKEGIRLVD